MPAPRKKVDNATRALRGGDLARMVEIDHGYTNQRRRRFFEKRLEAASAYPDDFIHVGLDQAGKLVAFAFARVLQGEFGRTHSVAVLDIVGVAREQQEHGYGHALMQGLRDRMREKDVRTLHSQADWTNSGLLRFFRSAGFELAPRLVLERAVNEPLAETVEEV
jgi:L-amino acid N-acyltransferase YncA